MKNRKLFFAAIILLAGLLVVYSNHFQNGFHFDDSHTILNNIYIQNIKNLPLFFKDVSTFSSLPSNQSYRPLVTATLAIDYWLGGGLNPFYFHLSTFIIFILQGVLMFFLFKKIFLLTSREEAVVYAALFSAALYMFHPANAETINYIIARSDSLSTFFVLLAFVLYLYSSVCRKYFLYLIPVIIGALAKIPAIMFAPLLFVYLLLFEKKNFISAVKISFFPFLLSILLYLIIHKMEINWVPGGTSVYLYFITQPFVILHYFKTFFLPLWLSADTDWATFNSFFEWKAIAGFIFCAALLFVGIATAQKEKLRPIAFGIFWFFIALIPTSSFIALSEVMNDHRVFFPYIGLALSVGWTVLLLFERINLNQILAVVFSLLIISAYGFGTHERNKVWRSDETLWKDVTEKSPNNPRGLMNYGLVLMARADYTNAEKYFLKGLNIWPYYAYLHINIGILKDATGFPKEAEQYFKNAIAFRSELPECYYYYADFLYKQKRVAEAVQMLNKTLELSPAHTNARYKLMAIYFENAEFEKLKLLADETLKLLPNDAQANYYLIAMQGKKSKLDLLVEAVKQNPTPENYLNLSLEYYSAGQYENCIRASEEALKLKPDYDLAYNNICSAYNMLKQWEKAIDAGEKAVHLNPNNQLAKNNLMWARSQKEKK